MSDDLETRQSTAPSSRSKLRGRVTASGWVLFTVTFVGITLIQLAWSLVLPPFRGIDEHDHAFRAASVAGGEWKPDYVPASHGRGDLATVPPGLVSAAEPICSALPYTGPDNCFPVSTTDDGRVRIATAAARYNPAFYWLMGTAGNHWDGAGSLYAMRALAAAASALLLAASIMVMRQWTRSIWPGAALLVVLTPMSTYTTSLAAPNGVELASALLLWSCLLCLPRAVNSPKGTRLLLAGATVAAVPLVTVRGLGPLWCGLIVLTWLLLDGGASLRTLRRSGAWLPIASIIVTAAFAGGVAWTVAADTNNPAGERAFFEGSPWPGIVREMFLWLLQAIAAFPTRTEPAPAAVYAIGLALFWILAAVGWKTSQRRVRLIMAGILAVSWLIPIALTLVSYSQIGFAWQGRYGWPYALGFLLIAGFSLEKRFGPSGQPTRRRVSGGIAVTVCVGTLVGQLAVLHQELLSSPLAQDPSWIRPSNLLVVALTATGFLFLAVATGSRTAVLTSPGISAEASRPLASAHDLAP